jgi:DNA polymerase I-like protein with 3'-5' exonuclease and polymerase domains
MIQMDDKVVRTYNARDAAVLLQVLPGMWEHMQEVGTQKTYREVSMKLVKPLLRMTQWGLKIDLARMKKKKGEFEKKARKSEAEIRKLCSLPEEFNLGSPDHLRLLLWGEKPKSLAKVLAEKEAIDNDPKRKKTTKKYAELESRIAVAEGTVPLYRPPSLSTKRTESGGLATDGETLIAFQRAAYNRVEGIKGLVKKAQRHEEEIGEIQKLLAFIELYNVYGEAQKLSSTFGGFPYGPDGRVHPSYKIHGTATGRLSSADPNIQQQPAAVQDVFVAPEGYSILKADYSNIELRMLAFITGEEVLIEAFESGQNIHDLNTKLLFGIDESHPTWKSARRAAKVYVFGRSYGGGVEGIYKQIIVAVPDLGLTLAHFKEMDRAYFDKLKSYSRWVQKMQKQARETRCIQTVFGRKRYLLGTPDEIERMALNTPIQGAAGEVALRAIIELDEKLKVEYPYARLITTVHDSILVEVPTKQRNDVAKLMKKIMEKTYLIEGRKVKFPVDIEAGPSWGETAPIEV